jgi:uncharacterized protein YggE
LLNWGPQQGDKTLSQESPAEGITVIGTGRISGKPDTLRGTVGVEVERPSIEEALDAANAAAGRVISAAREQGVEERDIQTTEFSVHPRFNEPPVHPGPGGPQDGSEIRGYVAANLVEVKIRDLNRVGGVLQGIVEAGGDAARVHGVSFTLEDNEELLKAAREAAFADAQKRANHYAELAGRGLGTLVSLSEAVESDPPRIPFEDRAGEGAAAQAVPVMPGEEEVTVRITAVWALS